MRCRAGVVIIEDGKIAMIKRVKEQLTYYVIPGGQKEPNETIQEAAIREAKEELGVDVELQEEILKLEFNGQQFYYTAKIIAGDFGTGEGEEFTKDLVFGHYEAVWLPIDEIEQVDFRPKEIISYIKKDF